MNRPTIDLAALKTVLVEALNDATGRGNPARLWNWESAFGIHEHLSVGNEHFDADKLAQAIHEKVAAPLLARIAELETESLAARQLRMLRSEDGE